MAYSAILLDFDYTIFDSDASSAAAFRHLMVASGFSNPAEHYPTFERINTALWRRVEEHTLTPDEVHFLRFEQLSSKIQFPLTPQEMADTYSEGMGANGELYPGALEVLETLAEAASLAMVTNGVGVIQRARIARLGIERFFEAIVISGEVGTAKPGSEIFNVTFERMGGPSKSRTLMVGDSLSSDIRGGTNYNIDTCWYNPAGKANASDIAPSFEVADLRDLLEIVDGSGTKSASASASVTDRPHD